MKISPARSIFTKLFVSYGVAFLIIVLGAAGARFFSTSSPNVEISLKHLRHYVVFLVHQIGNPPDLGSAGRLSLETELNIAVLGPGVAWASDGNLLERAKSLTTDEIFKFNLFHEVNDYILVVHEGAYRYVFSDFHSDHRWTILLWLFLSGTGLFALGVSYVLVHRLLKPIRVMNRVAQGLGVKDWKGRVNPKGKDELAVLGRTMDGMADRIEAYIRSMHDLLTAVSHEIRSPLTRMRVALELIDNPRVQESLIEDIRSLDRLTGDLLEQKRLTTQPGSLVRESVQLQKWIAEILEVYSRAPVPVKLFLEGEESIFSLDRPRMDIVARNLIENALRHAPGSPVAVTLQTPPITGTNHFVLEVVDQGPGMPQVLVDRIGEPFLLVDSSRTGDRKGGGFGLGLSIVRAVVEAHGGRIVARNIRPHGFSVTIAF